MASILRIGDTFNDLTWERCSVTGRRLGVVTQRGLFSAGPTYHYDHGFIDVDHYAE